MNDNQRHNGWTDRGIEAPVRQIKGPTIRLYGGSYFNYDDPDGSFYTIEDVAHALSNQCRFAGHTNWHYSVAQHSVLCSYVVEEGFEYDALMHDATEFVVTDLVKPLKNTLPDFQAIEGAVEASVFRRFGVRNPLPQPVKLADLVMLKTEQHQLMSAANDDWMLGVDAADIQIGRCTPEEAKHQFLRRYHELRFMALPRAA